MERYTVPKFKPHDITVEVPASKSILNRALLLAAFSKGTVRLRHGDYAEDTRALLACLRELGIQIERTSDGSIVHGGAPNRKATLNVMSAGTAARFLPVMLAFCGGDYYFTASEQMKRRPMEILSVLNRHGVKIEYFEQEEHFPFRLYSKGICGNSMEIDTDKSTQYASGIMMAAANYGAPFRLRLKGSRINSSYLAMTLTMLHDFHIPFTKADNEIVISPQTAPPPCYTVEPDLSGACYFYALSLLCACRVCVKGVQRCTMQGDFAFLRLLEERGVQLIDSDDGLIADGASVTCYAGFQNNMRDFSDQALTVAALAPFATSPTVLTGISHIRLQECDRIHAIEQNLKALGVPVTVDRDCIKIEPTLPHATRIATYGDHRVAMAFSLLGLKIGNIVIEDPDCVKKTFDGFFSILNKITK